MYRSFIPLSLTTIELRLKNKDLPENVKWCNGLCQDIRDCSEFSPNKHMCKNCINLLNIAIKKVENNKITIEQFKQNPNCILDGNKDDNTDTVPLKNAWSVKKKKAQITLKKNAPVAKHVERLKILLEMVRTLIHTLPLLKNLKITSHN